MTLRFMLALSSIAWHGNRMQVWDAETVSLLHSFRPRNGNSYIDFCELPSSRLLGAISETNECWYAALFPAPLLLLVSLFLCHVSMTIVFQPVGPKIWKHGSTVEIAWQSWLDVSQSFVCFALTSLAQRLLR